MSILDLLVVSSLSVLLVIATALMIVNKMKHSRSLATVAQLIIDRSAMSDEIDRLSFMIDNSSDLNDGFIKFLSESRDEAFEYISDVQEAILSIKNAMDINDEALISEAYTKLISFLPSENQDVVE